MESTHSLKIMNADGADLLDNPIKARDLTDSSTLADIRKFLEKEQEISGFNFIDSDDCLITKSYEESTKTKDLAMIKISVDRKKKSNKKVEISDISNISDKSDSADIEEKPIIESGREVKQMQHTFDKVEWEKANIKELASLSLKDNNKKRDGEYISIKDLNKAQFNELLEGLNYRFGFRLTKNGVMNSLSLPFNKKEIPSDFQSYVVKHDKTIREIREETSLSKILLMKFGCLSVDASLSCPYVGISGYYSEETNQTEDKNMSTKYNFKYYDVGKGEINLNNYRELSKEFLTFFNDKEITLELLNKFVETFGAYVVDSVIVGGRLFTVETASTSSSISEEETGSNKGIGYMSPMTSGNVGGGFEKENREKKGVEYIKTNQELRIENKGGDSLKVDDESEWRNSLSNYRTWDSIEITKMSRTIDLLPKNILDAINKKFLTVAKVNLKFESFLPEGTKETDWVNIRNKEGLFFCMKSNNILKQDYCGISENYHWKFIKQSDGSFAIQSKFKSLVIQAQGKEKALTIDVGVFEGSDKQKWYLQKYMDTNYFSIINKLSQLAIDCYQNSQVGWQYGSWDPIEGVSNHAYKCEKVFVLQDESMLTAESMENWNWFRIRSKTSEMYLRGGSDLTQANYQNIDEFKFHFYDGIFQCKKNFAVIDNLVTGDFLQRTSCNNGNKVGMYKCTGKSNQKWWINNSSDLEYNRLENNYAKKSLDNGGSKNEGTGFIIWDSDNNNCNQQFKFEKIL